MNPMRARRNPVEELAEAFLARYRRGERPSIEEYASAHPELAADIRDVFPALAVLEEAGGAKSSPSVSEDGRRDRPSPFPEKLDDYRIIRELRRGGMGTVYEAEQESLGRRVALKVLPWGASRDPLRLERFRREARAAARLHHTNIVPVFESGEHLGNYYYVMQFIQGQALDEVLRELRRLRRGNVPETAAHSPVADNEPRSSTDSCLMLAGAIVSGQFAPAEDIGREPSSQTIAERKKHPDGVGTPSPDADRGGTLCDSSELSRQSDRQYYRSVARIGLQVAEGLSYAHAQNLLHRDIKPSNLLLDARGTVWITDFGLAKDGGEELTRTGDVVGTLRYLAPERFSGAADARSDVYSLGVTLYEMIALRPAFAASDRVKLIREIEECDPPAPRKLDGRVPRDLDTIVRKAMARGPADRYASAAALAEDLTRFLEDRPIVACRLGVGERMGRWCRRNRLAASLLVTLVVVVALAFAGVSWKWRESELARRAERAARDEADQHFYQRRQAFDDLLAAQRLLERGREAIDQQRWDDAALALTRAIAVRPEHQGAWDARGMLYVRLGLWNLARPDLDRAFELRPPEASWRWLLLALLRLDAGDRDGYARLCKQMRERFEGSGNPQSAIDLVRTRMALPDPSANAPRLATVAQSLAASKLGAVWHYYVAGLAEFRAGRDERAVAALLRAFAPDSGWREREIALPLLARANHRSGNADDALRALVQAEAVFENWLEQMVSLPESLRWADHQEAEPRWPVAWSDWLEFRAHYRQAHLVIRGTVPPDDARLGVLRARALAALGYRKEADELYGAALQTRPDDSRICLEAHLNRAYAEAHQGNWSSAAEYFALASELRPNDSRLWNFRVPTRLAAGDLDAYRRDCGAMFARFANTSEPIVANDLASACVLGPGALPDVTRLLPVARLAATWHHGNVRLLGAALYRAGKYREARDCFAEAADLLRPTAWEWCFCAMIAEHLGHHGKARRYLEQAEAWKEAANSRVGDDVTVDGPAWNGLGAMIETYVLLTEARRVASQ